MPSNEKRAREMAKITIKHTEAGYSNVCKKMVKESTPEKKKEIEDIQTKKILDLIKKTSLEEVEERFKVGIKFAKLMRATTRRMKKFQKPQTPKNIKRNENIKRRSTCRYIKKQGSYVTHYGALPKLI